METISLRLPSTLVQRLEKELSLSQRSRSQLLREALEDYLARRERARLLEEFQAEAAALDRGELTELAADFAAAETEALERAEKV